MEKDYKSLPTEIFTRESINVVSLMVSGSTIGLMGPILREHFVKDFGMGKVSGRKVLEPVISMKVIISKIKNKGMVYLLGQLVMCTRVNSKMT